jgi:hypothetical protein
MELNNYLFYGIGKYLSIYDIYSLYQIYKANNYTIYQLIKNKIYYNIDILKLIKNKQIIKKIIKYMYYNKDIRFYYVQNLIDRMCIIYETTKIATILYELIKEDKGMYENPRIKSVNIELSEKINSLLYFE